VPENYVHRIGRTARAGADGKAIAFCSPDEMGELKDIEKAMKAKIPVASGAPWEVTPEQAKAARQAARPQGHKGGGRPQQGRPAANASRRPAQGAGGPAAAGKPGGQKPRRHTAPRRNSSTAA
jgi:ATP-dependent RNA helicase RhlE